MAVKAKKTSKKTRRPVSPAASAAKFFKDVSKKADRLHKLRKETDALKEKHRREMEKHFAEMSKLKAEVLIGLKAVNLSSVKVRGGASYYISKQRGFQITNTFTLRGWAIERKLVNPDMTLVKQELRKLAKKESLPSFAVPVESETISYRSNKKIEK